VNRFIFLDIDGVLNCHEWLPDILCGQIHKDKVERLNHVLQVTHAKIVLSSAWRYIVHRGEMNLAGMEWLLRSHGVLADRLIGITRADKMMPSSYDGRPVSWPVENERGQQIREWLDNWCGRVENIVAIDDLDLGITEARIPLVRVDGKFGLTDADVQSAIDILTA